MDSIFNGKMTLCASAASGVEAVLKRELSALGFDPSPAENGKIFFDGNMDDIAVANVFLRTANRVFVKIAEFCCEDFDGFFDGVAAVEWQYVLPFDARIVVEARSVKSKLFATSALQSVAKKAVVASLQRAGAGVLPETGAEYRLHVSLFEDKCTLLLDTTGVGLHKRGYRNLVGRAPLKETLAAAIALLSVWNPDRAFADVFCGSGTICIEAALIGANIAPGVNRDFAFSTFSNANGELSLRNARVRACDTQARDVKLKISGFDIDPKAVKLARSHAVNAGVADSIHFQVGDMRNFSSALAHGVLISNPPYGQRLSDEKELKVLYADFGKMFASLKDWSLYCLTGCDRFEDWFGRRADKVRKLYNSEIECRLYRFLGSPPKKKSAGQEVRVQPS